MNRDSLINCINEIALNTLDQEEKVKYEAGLKRGITFVPVYNESQMAEMDEADVDQVKLDPDEEDALANASVDDIMALADILNTNPQDFIMEAYADPLQYFEPDPPNETILKEVFDKLKSNDRDYKDVNFNNLGGISEQDFCDIFKTLRNHDNISMSKGMYAMNNTLIL